MQIRRHCPACRRLIQVGRYGKFFTHYNEKGKYKSGFCIGSNQTVNETKELMDDHDKK